MTVPAEPRPAARVLFVDWHGVLSSAPFWSSVLDDRDSPLAQALAQRLRTVWASDLGDAWMRGHADVGDIVEPLSDLLTGHPPDFLHGTIVTDCLSMPVNSALTACMRTLPAGTFRVVATDNAAAFEEAFGRARRARTGPLETMSDVARWVDGLVCSSTVGVLKAQNPAAFFGPWLASKGLTFADAALVDDRADNRAAFHRCGGTSIEWADDLAVQDLALERIRAFAAGRAPLATAAP